MSPVQTLENAPSDPWARPDRTGCFEAVYAALFGYTYGILWIAIAGWLKLLSVAFSQRHNAYPTTFDLQGEALWFDFLMALSILLAIFQVGRAYHYTHLFDEQHENPAHFISRFTSGPRFVDRLLRVGVASLVVVAVELYARHGLVQYHLTRLKDGVSNYQLLLPLGFILFFIFLLLLVWDLNLLFWRKRGMTRIEDQRTFETSLIIYDPPLKMAQRVGGFAYSGILCALLYFGPNIPLLVIFGASLLLFGLVWFGDYLPNRHRFWWRDANRVIPDKGSVWLRRFFTENLSWLSTLLRLFFPRALSSKSTRYSKAMKKTIVIVVMLAALISAWWLFAPRHQSQSGAISMAIGKNVWCSLPIVAKEKGFFKEEGLDVNFNFQDAGRYCMDALLSDSVDLAAVVEANVAYIGFAGNRKPVVVAEIVSSSCGIISRRSAGINSESDLRGKKIAYTPATGAEPFLYRFLAKHGISNGEVELRKMQPKALQPALVAKEVDAAATWEPFIYNCNKAMGGDAAEFRDPEAFTGFMMLATSRDFAAKKPDSVRAVLRALRKAELYLKDNPKDSHAMLARYLGMEPEAIQRIWPYFTMSLRMNRTDLINAINYVADNARTIDPEFTGKETPDYNSYIDDSFLAGIGK
ncbi:MAG TPA: NrtA/SsuA/CpmA family ABC transporter substrate-binding protein [Chthoniobacterales bacterium]|nr:NrtA/SsuA/CpmA family ABC transporter substrate-binding protein [Chthoniobacterales bacterium]